MLNSNLFKSLHNLKGNQPLLLDNPQKVWVVKSGTIAIFLTKVVAGEPIGDRHYLCSINPGEALFGIALWGEEPLKNVKLNENYESFNYGILAVTIQESEVLELDFVDLIAEIAVINKAAILLLESWIDRLSKLVNNPTISTKNNPLKLEQFSQETKLSKGQVLQASSQSIIWIQIHQGSTAWMGREELKLDAESSYFPLAASTWIESLNLVEFSTTNIEKIAVDLFQSVSLFHSYFCRYLQIKQEQKLATEIQQFQQLQQLNVQVTENAFNFLASALQPQQTQPEETPLLMAAGAVARAMGITIRPPIKSENLQRIDPVEAIAIASKIRIRRVSLNGEWWKQEHHPLLAFKTDNSPVALLIDKSKGYRYILFDPETKKRTLVTQDIAANINSKAYLFYRPLPQVINKAFEVFKFGIKGYETETIKVILVGILGTILGMAVPQATAILINQAIPNGDRLLLLQLALGLLAVSFGKTAFNLYQGLVALRITNGINNTLQIAVWDRLLQLKPSFFRQFTTGDLLVRIMSISQIYSVFSGATQRTLLSGLFSLLNLGLMFIYDLKLTLIAIGITILAVILTMISSFILLSKERKQEELSGEIQGLVVQLINGVPKLRVAVAESRAFAAWAKKYSEQNQLTKEIIQVNDIVSVFNELLSLVSLILLYWFGFLAIQGSSTGENSLTLGTFLAFNAAFGIFFGGVTSLSNTLIQIIEIAPLWERSQPILQGQLEFDEHKANPDRLSGQIRLENITFRYREDSPIVLHEVNIHADPGEFIAIVGPSGSGKSTIFRLLLGFETPQNGKVYYDGQDLGNLDLPAVRRQLGVVLQNGRVTQGSILENITGGALLTVEEAWEAAKMAGLAEDIERMPMGMQTIVSEGGTNLSGGQRQRLLIARSLIFKPPIILLDEATSYLDNSTQAIVTESLEKMNATRIIIAHRLSTIRHADRIYVLESGRILQVGSFAELIQQPGLFAKLVARQLE
ncbi:NHLP bacteriocin export ABC transporter permease/ATPase subunit [[Phormidium ambiguum] IAM M-71]|uniref:NHLP bacteriocin export ABC transporter permease/ATPase subunit n=1 Tax=[Phormidium ambiguum] IAM M-71 TaxID=454136 RepID=A0A1U7I974_9CYAN|nr:NHLP bacteriocin export ABC transporter permease/ATPase subunit [Phormidium ambiguum]OKH33023.1 NHLP bacteriocin export ABC transporter permease/ATPase subunit [Phormidium ambiguum IAM M-71]